MIDALTLTAVVAVIAVVLLVALAVRQRREIKRLDELIAQVAFDRDINLTDRMRESLQMETLNKWNSGSAS